MPLVVGSGGLENKTLLGWIFFLSDSWSCFTGDSCYMCPPSQDNIVGWGLPGLAAATFEPRWSLAFDCHYGQFLSCRPFATQDPCAPTTHLQMDRHEAKWTYHRNWLVVSNNVSFLTGDDTNELFLSLRLLPQDGPRCLHLKDLRRRSCYQQVTEPIYVMSWGSRFKLQKDCRFGSISGKH